MINQDIYFDKKKYLINSLTHWWPSDTISHYRYGSTLVQVMACCLTAPSHYLNQWYLLAYSWSKFTENVADITHHKFLKCTYLKILLNLPGANELMSFNTLRPRQNGRHFPDNIFKCILLNENVWILLKISLKFVPQGPINNIPALVQIMPWHWPGDKPLSGPMMVKLPTHICVTRPQWVKYLPLEQSSLGIQRTNKISI